VKKKININFTIREDDPVRGPPSHQVRVNFGDETQTLSPFVEEAMTLLGLGSEQKDECFKYILAVITEVRAIISIEQTGMRPPPAQQKRELGNLLRALKRVRMQIGRALFPEDAGVANMRTIYDALPGAIEYLIRTQTDTSGANWRETRAKSVAAEGAFQLLTKFSSTAPTKTKDGPFYTLAALLYEAACGREGDLRRHCDALLTHKR
jgi:hypothetical protein